MLTMEEYDSSSSSEDEFYLMALGVVAAVSAKPKEGRKRRIWVREIYQDREADVIKHVTRPGYSDQSSNAVN